MSNTVDKKMIIRAFPMAWVHKIEAGALTETWRFDNLVNCTMKFPKDASSATSAEYTEVPRADGAIWKFPKYNLSLLATTGEDITEAAKSNDASGYGEITLVTNEADLDSTTYTAFLKAVQDNKDALFMVTIGTGITQAYPSRPDGWAIMVGKLSNDIEMQLANSPSTLTMTFISYKNSGLVDSDLTATSLYTAIDWKLGGTGKDVTGLKPGALTTADNQAEIDSILAGKIALIPYSA